LSSAVLISAQIPQDTSRPSVEVGVGDGVSWRFVNAKSGTTAELEQAFVKGGSWRSSRRHGLGSYTGDRPVASGHCAVAVVGIADGSACCGGWRRRCGGGGSGGALEEVLGRLCKHICWVGR
jgi:hypothetical protein